MPKLKINSNASRLKFPGLVVSSFEIRSMPLNELHSPVCDVPAFAEEVAESIRANGLANPVIVVRGPREDLARELEALGDPGDKLPDVPVLNCVYGGTNRVTAARNLGYTHIDCVLLPSFALGERLQDLQRASYHAGQAREVGASARV
jgi:hypothetical protein